MKYSPARCIAGRRCMVSTGHPLSTLAALDVLRNSGNAVDAAVAASAVSCVVLPHACGLGGDAFAVGYDSGPRQTWALNASGPSPQSLLLDRFSSGIPEDELISCTVPGIVHGWHELLRQRGTMDPEELLQPAVTHAEGGFIVDETLVELVASNRDKLAKHAESAAIFFPDGRELGAGCIFRQPALCGTLQRLASEGYEDFYRGKTASEIVQFMHRNGGLLRQEDLEHHKSIWQEPLRSTFLDCEVVVTPPNSIALLLLAQLRLLSAKSLAGLEHNSAEYVDALLTIKRRAFGDCLPLLGDPEAMTMLPDEILERCNPLRVAKEGKTLHKTMSPAPPDTTCIVVADEQGNVVSLIQSIFHHFGCGAIAGSTGVILNNRMLGFTIESNQVNTIGKGKRTAHTLSPAMLFRNQLPYLAICTPGAYGQTQTLLQIIVNFHVFGMELQQALEAPRWFDGLDHDLLLESRFEPSTIEALKQLGHNPTVGQPWDPLTGGVQAIRIVNHQSERVLYGAADPRRHGCALGW